MPVSMIREFLRFEAAGGIILILAAAIALILANSPLGVIYTQFLEVPVAVQVGGLEIAKPLLLWINDGLMAIRQTLKWVNATAIARMTDGGRVDF